MSATDLTMYLQRYAQGEEEALEEMLPMVYQHLRNLARNIRREKGASPTLNTTALVHEAYLKLVQQGSYENRLHFFRVAARAMRQIVYTHAEKRQAQKRGGKEADLSLEGIELALPAHRWEEALSMEQGLRQLERLQPRQGQVVECRFFGDMSVEDTAQALNLSTATVKRDWNLARAWLYRFLQDNQAS